ncbi:MAG: membrane protein insertion efficiency factor YidD [Chlamydiota bacterium]
MNIVERCITGMVGAYQRLVSPLLGPHCRYHPTCSQYTVDAVRARGTLVGLALGALRVARCNPFFTGGYDPVKRGRRHERMSGGCSPVTDIRMEKE